MANNLFDDFKNKIPFEQKDIPILYYDYEITHSETANVNTSGSTKYLTFRDDVSEGNSFPDIQNGDDFIIVYEYNYTAAVSIQYVNLRPYNNFSFTTNLRLVLAQVSSKTSGRPDGRNSNLYIDSLYNASPGNGMTGWMSLGLSSSNTSFTSLEIKYVLWLKRAS